VLAQSLPSSTAIPARSGLNPRQREQSWPHPPPALAEAYCRPTFVPQAQPRPELEKPFAWWLHPLPRWRAREIERQEEMDRIAEPYIARLREVSRQKKVDAEARALAGQQTKDRAEDSGSPIRYSFGENEKKAQKELKEVERQQRIEEKRQARKDAREERRRRRSAEKNTPDSPRVRGKEAGRKSSGRSKPYSIPHPATRSPRRLHVMPGEFGSDDLTSDQTCLISDAPLWRGLKSTVGMGYRLWTQC
jgi:hypothetical protein